MLNLVNSIGKLTISFIFIFVSFYGVAQSKMIEKVFRLLPSEYVYDLSNATKDSMLSGKTYYPSDNDSKSILAFNYGESSFVRDYMYISMSYETSQRATGMIELRSFEMKGGKLIIVSNTGGIEGINYQQNNISVFLFDGKSRLKLYKEKIFPEWSNSVFLKSGVPDSIKKVIENNSNLTFDFSKTNVVLSINSPYLLDNKEYRKWMKGSQIRYAWTGKKFKAGRIQFLD